MALKKMVSEESVIPETIQGQTIKIATIADKEIEAPDIDADIRDLIDDVAEISSDLKLTKSDVDTISADVSNVKSNVSTLSANLISTQNELADAVRAIEETNDRVDNLSADYTTTKNDVAVIKSKIPNAASKENQLADKDFVNSSINNYAAFYITKNISGDAFATKEELTNATVYYSGGQVRLPTKNDYCIVLEDETKTTSLGVNPTTRYSYNEQWEYQYIVNNTALTQAQVNAINSGVTKDIVDKRVIPSTEYNGYAVNAVNATNAQNAQNAVNAQNAANSDTATYAQTADIATTATYAPNYTPLSTYNSLLSGYTSTLLSGVTSDDQTVSFYILTKNA